MFIKHTHNIHLNVCTYVENMCKTPEHSASKKSLNQLLSAQSKPVSEPSGTTCCEANMTRLGDLWKPKLIPYPMVPLMGFILKSQPKRDITGFTGKKHVAWKVQPLKTESSRPANRQTNMHKRLFQCTHGLHIYLVCICCTHILRTHLNTRDVCTCTTYTLYIYTLIWCPPYLRFLV